MRNHTTKATVLLVALAGALTLGACGGGSSTDTTAPADSTSAATPTISVTGQWARTSAMTATMGAAYMTISSDMDDELTGASVDASVAMDAQIHEMVPATDSSDSGMMTDSTMASDNMVMQEVDSIAISGGTSVELKPGGYHIMLMDLAKPLELGTSVEITLTFAKAGDVKVTVPVMDDAPM